MRPLVDCTSNNHIRVVPRWMNIKNALPQHYVFGYSMSPSAKRVFEISTKSFKEFQYLYSGCHSEAAPYQGWPAGYGGVFATAAPQLSQTRMQVRILSLCLFLSTLKNTAMWTPATRHPFFSRRCGQLMMTTASAFVNHMEPSHSPCLALQPSMFREDAQCLFKGTYIAGA